MQFTTTTNNNNNNNNNNIILMINIMFLGCILDSQGDGHAHGSAHGPRGPCAQKKLLSFTSGT